MNNLIISNAKIVNEGTVRQGNLLVENGIIRDVAYGALPLHWLADGYNHTDAGGKFLLPGAIDDQVHFREPGLTHKGEIATESAAAAAGGITSYMEMPNTNPQTTNQQELEAKYAIAAEKSAVNYSFYIGATNDNLPELVCTDFEKTCGVKVFMGSSTGNMLVDNEETLERIFKEVRALIAVHSEYEPIIQNKFAEYKAQYGDDIPMACHPLIRNSQACYQSTIRAVNLAKKHNTRLHVLHLSTSEEMALFEPGLVEKKQITAEVCVHHLWFSDADYPKLGSRIKWNPAIKSEADRKALFQALKESRIDVVATDHAPHTLKEKSNLYTSCPSGGPLVQHSLQAMLEFVHRGELTLEFVVDKMCHNPARLFRIKNRGFLKPGYFADMILVDFNQSYKVTENSLLYKCGWSPFEGITFRSTIDTTWVNGERVYHQGEINQAVRGQRLTFRV